MNFDDNYKELKNMTRTALEVEINNEFNKVVSGVHQISKALDVMVASVNVNDNTSEQRKEVFRSNIEHLRNKLDNFSDCFEVTRNLKML